MSAAAQANQPASPLQSLRDTDAGLPVHFGNAGRIAHQATGLHVVTDVVHRRNPQTICQRDDLLAAAAEKRIRPDQKCIDPLPGKFGECRVNFSLGTGIQDDEFDAQSLRGLLRVFYLGLKTRALDWQGSRPMWQQAPIRGATQTVLH